MKKMLKRCLTTEVCVGLLLLAMFWLLSPVAHAQATKPSDASNSTAGNPAVRPLPPGVFRGSLPPGKIDPALVEAQQNAQDAIIRGETLLKSGHVNDAIAEFHSALNYVPNSGIAYQRLAEAYVALGKLNEASQAFHRVLIEGFGPSVGSGAGGNADIWAEYALVLVKTKQDAEAIQAYNRAAFIADYEFDQNPPHNPVPHLKVLFPEIVLGDVLPEQVPYSSEHLQALADVLLAYEQHGFWSYQEIKARAEEAAKLYPDSAAVQYYLGEALSGSYYGVLDSPVKDKTALWAACEEDKKARVVAYKKAAELGDDKMAAAAKERLTQVR